VCNLSTAHIHTPSCPLWRGCGLAGFRHLPTLTTHSTQIVYSQQAPLPLDWWLPSAANLEPLPPSHCHSTAHRVLAASAECATHLLRSTLRSTSPHVTLGGSHTCQSGLGLAIRLVVGGHYPRLHPTTCHRFPIPFQGGCYAQMERLLLTHLQSPLRETTNQRLAHRPGLHGFSDLRGGGEVWDLTPFG